VTGWRTPIEINFYYQGGLLIVKIDFLYPCYSFYLL